MSVYLKYKEALNLIDATRRWQEMNKDAANKLWLDQQISGSTIRTILCEGEILVEKESLVNRFNHWINQDSNSMDRIHISKLQLKSYPDPANESRALETAILDDILILHYALDTKELQRSLESEGKFRMFTCNCGDFQCGGLYVNVKHTGNITLWESAYPSSFDYPITYLEGSVNSKRALFSLPFYFLKSQLKSLI